MRARVFLAFLSISALSACNRGSGPSPAEAVSDAERAQQILAGPWRVVETQWIDSTGTASPNPVRESLVLFSNGYYSAGMATSAEPTVPFTNEDAWTPTDEERIARYTALTFNSGTFAATDSLIVTKPVFAKNPSLINGGVQFHYVVSGDTLTLTGRTVVSVAGVPEPSYAAGGHEVTKLVRIP